MKLLSISFLYSFLILYHPFLFAQELIFKNPKKLPRAINSSWEESNLFVSENNSTLIFIREEDVLSEVSKVLYYVTKNEYGSWEYATQFPEGDKVGLQVVGTTDTGKLYFLDNHNSKFSKLYVQQCDNELCLHHVKQAKFRVRKGKIHDIYIHPSDSIMVLSMMSDKAENYGLEDIYVSLKDKDEVWHDPINIGISVNGSASEITPFLSADQRRLFFSSNKKDSTESYNIFYTDRLYDSWTLWTVPKKLDNNINTIADETSFYLIDDMAYFISNKEENSNIYQASKMKYKPLLNPR